MAHKNNKAIPVNTIDSDFFPGISIEINNITKADVREAQLDEESVQSHRDEGYTFHILEKGEVKMEIDFRTYVIEAPAVVFLHPSQVHRMIDLKDIVVCSLSIDNENLNPAYLKILEDITPSAPLLLASCDIDIVTSCFGLCLNFYKHNSGRLYHPLLKDSCNTLIAFLLSKFIERTTPEQYILRYDKIAHSFRRLLEKKYLVMKRPGEYAQALNISTPYLNECVKNATGFSVSQLIHERVVLEAKRLLYHTDKSVKEIAFELGYADYPYFSRLFRKVAGVSALDFRAKNFE